MVRDQDVIASYQGKAGGDCVHGDRRVVQQGDVTRRGADPLGYPFRRLAERRFQFIQIASYKWKA